MELHNLQHADGAKHKRKRMGRGAGSGHGKTAGRGSKGQQSRSGYSRKSGFEGGQMPINRRLPKRGFYHEARHPLAEVNIDVLCDRFDEGATISTESLQELGVVKVLTGGVKLLGRGEMKKKFVVKVQAVSAGAREKIEKAGGSVEIVPILAPVEAKAE